MPNITVKGIPEELYDRLKRRAAEEHRSLNGQVIACLERELLAEKPDPEALLQKIDSLRQKLFLKTGSTKDLQKAKESGRP